MRTKGILSALLVAIALVVCGCAAPGGGTGSDSSNSSASVQVDPAEVEKGTAEYHGWVPDVIEFVSKHNYDNGVLVECTGEISKGYTEETTDTVTLVYPGDFETEDDTPDPMEELKITDANKVVEVHYAKPVETTKWRHLTTVKGMAFADPSNPNKIIIRGAMDTED